MTARIDTSPEAIAALHWAAGQQIGMTLDVDDVVALAAEIARLTDAADNHNAAWVAACDRIAALEAERDEARAQVAVAYEAAANLVLGLPMTDGVADVLAEDIADDIRALTTPDATAALAARDAAMRNEGRKSVKVKPLVWEDVNETGTIQDAAGFRTIYRVWANGHTGEVRYKTSHMGAWLFVQTVEAAKAAAQAEYEASILATLEPEGGE
ncbi:hypothetical protein [Gemmobacter nectariphilus]|uniref:hypothetical protein n=1 Tax=Gemmobacter nectariphilus TaxID=220343 RepID=UPI000483A2DF|nr:hypothetical protein [Gemmobacter nectariphilus]